MPALGARLRPFRHNRMDKLEQMLERAAGDGGGVLVVVDGVFSMEGDIAPLDDIVELCGRFGARLLVDEAHGVGVLGARGTGACELFGLEGRVDLRMGTFSKSLASCGGFIAGPADVVEFLRIAARAFLFTASAVPAAIGAALEAVRICRREGGPLFERVLDNAAYLHRGLTDLGLRMVEPTTLPDGSEVDHAGRPRRRGGLADGAAVEGAVRRRCTRTSPCIPLPPGLAPRTSLMATHEREHLDRALAIFSDVIGDQSPELPSR